ncbi:cyclic peptide export ABC transporter [Hyalangium versicolor]|uniref:cyclic peptide export ABC transporter n=1 Tax=Hyalangium versicolor TaxID=2861190 RepID=UPI001CCEDE8B|nr:cyclic peptide export ABC transporter [Hyalangium versicolor]
MNLISFLIQRARGTFLLAIVFGLLSGASSTGLISLVTSALTGGELSRRAGFWGFLGLALLTMLARFLSQHLLNRLHHRALYEVRTRLSRQVLSTPLRRLEELGLPQLTKAFTQDALTVSFTLGGIPGMIINLTIIVGCLLYLAWLSWTVFFATLGFIVCAGFSYWLLHKSAYSTLQTSHQVEGVLFKTFQSLTEGIKELKLHRGRRTALMGEMLDPNASRLLNVSMKSSTFLSAATSWSSFIFFLLISLLLFVLPQYRTVSLETLVGYTMVVLYLQQPLDSLVNTLPMITRGSMSLAEIDRLSLGTEQLQEKLEAAPAEPSSFEKIELRGVAHTYFRENEDSRFTLGPIHLTLQRGERVFIIGGNGSGKTTLVKLLTGLYTPEEGELFVDGQRVTEENRDNYRQHFSAVFFDFFLFDSLLGLPRTNLEESAKAHLETLRLDRKVQLRPGGELSTTELSQGQRKRLALLTSYLEDRPIYVFDEWAADQDPVFKDIFYNQILDDLKRRGKTVVVISHDSRYFRVADRIVQLDDGKLVEPEQARATAS